MKKTSIIISLLLVLLLGTTAVNAQINGGAIQFDAGESNAWIKGNLSPNNSIIYTFYATAGQIVSPAVSSTNSSAVIGISEDDDWYSILRPESKYMYYTFPLSKTGTYYLTVKDNGSGGDYKLTLSIPPLNLPATQPVATSGLTAGTIQFSQGQSTALINGWLNTNSSITYDFTAAKYQILSLALKSTTNSAVMGLKDSKDYAYLTPDKKWSYYISPLYDAGPFKLTIYNNGPATNFTLQMTIPPLDKPVAPPQTAPIWQPAPVFNAPLMGQVNGGAIQFGAGETAASMMGNIPANSCVRYTLYGGNNYTMIAMVGSASGTATLGISDAGGSVHLPAANNATYWMMPLSKTTTYYIDVCNPGSQATDFGLNVIIPAKIAVDTYTRSAVKSGSLKNNSVISYSIDGQTNQTLTVSLTGSTTPQAFLRITGMGDGIVYLDNNQFQTYWSGSLPAAQEYLIDVVAYNAASNYQLTFSLR